MRLASHALAEICEQMIRWAGKSWAAVSWAPTLNNFADVMKTMFSSELDHGLCKHSTQEVNKTSGIIQVFSLAPIACENENFRSIIKIQ